MAQDQVQAAGATQQKAHRKNPKPPVRKGKVPAQGKAVSTARETGKAVAIHQPQPPSNFLQVIMVAATDPRCDTEKMRALLAMQQDIENRDAKKAFTVAFNALQAELPVINRDGNIDHSADGGDTTRSGRKALKAQYATYPNLNRVVGPLLKKHGFTFSTTMEPDPSGTMVAASSLEHVGGHSRTTHFRVTADTSGGKNNQQGWGSSQQYAMRYNMIALLNIVTEARQDVDNDGVAMVTPEQLAALIKLADDAGADKRKFCEVMDVESLAAIPQARYTEAVKQLKRKLAAKQKLDNTFPGDR